MILKIERYNSVLGFNWKFIDDIEELDFGIEEIDRKVPRINSDIIIEDWRKFQDKQAATSTDKWSVGIFVCKRRSGNLLRIEFDTSAYLLHDNGRTLDAFRINGLLPKFGEPKPGEPG